MLSQFLQLSVSYNDKMNICKSMRQFLCSPRCHDEMNARSHYLLEVVLYQSAISLETGRYKIGIEVLEVRMIKVYKFFLTGWTTIIVSRSLHKLFDGTN